MHFVWMSIFTKFIACRTASEVRVKHAQGDAAEPAPSLPSPSPTTTTGGFADILSGIPGTSNAFPFLKGIGIDMTSGQADEAADRALSSVARKLDKSLSVESTVLELLAEATDITNLATIFYGTLSSYTAYIQAGLTY
jgi:ataxia telangiectasia mutated family protein